VLRLYDPIPLAAIASGFGLNEVVVSPTNVDDVNEETQVRLLDQGGEPKITW